METFQECGLQMLREFRAQLQRTPLPVSQTQLLQLLALNMFAISNTQLKGNMTHFSLRVLQDLDRLLRQNPEIKTEQQRNEGIPLIREITFVHVLNRFPSLYFDNDNRE